MEVMQFYAVEWGSQKGLDWRMEACCCSKFWERIPKVMQFSPSSKSLEVLGLRRRQTSRLADSVSVRVKALKHIVQQHSI